MALPGLFSYPFFLIMLDFLPKRSTITGVYYANLLDQLRIAIREKRRGKLSKGVLLQQDNARVHTCKVAMEAVERNGYELIPHPAYSPDLAPSNFFLFPNLKKDIRGLHFRSDECMWNYQILLLTHVQVSGQNPLVQPRFTCPKIDIFSYFWKKTYVMSSH